MTMAVDNLKQKTIKAFLWNTAEKFLVKGSFFIITVILARILSPSDYGLIGMLTIFIGISTLFIESGFATTLIQRKDCSDIDYSTAFYTNLGVALFFYILLFIAAPFVADFYDEPKLCSLLRVLSINFVIGSFNIVQRAQLTKKLDFKSLAKINFYGTFIGGSGGIIMAYWGCGVWSLVSQTIMTTTTMLFLFLHYSKWIPSRNFSVDSFHALFGFGSKLLIAGVVATIVNNITTIAIGKVYKSDQLGYYTRANQFSMVVAYTVNDIVGTVTFPVLSGLQNERERMINLYKKALFYTALMIFPIMALMSLLAYPLVSILLTDKWIPCVFMLQILCIARMFTPLSAINMNVLNAIGRSDLYMKVDLIKVPMVLVVLALTIPMGLEAIVIGNLITSFISFFVNAYYPGKLFGYGAWKQIKDYKKLFFSLLLMIGGVEIVLNLVDDVWWQLICGGVVGIAIYIVSCLILKVVSYKDFIKCRLKSC